MSIPRLLIGSILVIATAVAALAQVCAFDDHACQTRRAEELHRQRLERLLQGERRDPPAVTVPRRRPSPDAGAAGPREARPHNEGSRTRAVPTAPQ